MAIIFPRWTNKIPLMVGLGAPLLFGATVLAVWYWFSPEFTDVGYAPGQPIQYSHKQHATDLGMDCRACHNTVERSSFAAIPQTESCMRCHRVVLKDSPKLALLRASSTSGKAVPWIRVHMLPDYAYFDHRAHLAAGVGCVSCHGRIDHMKVVWQTKSLSMSWCLQCHRAPTPHLRPQDKITTMGWDPVKAQYDPNRDPARQRKINPPVHCSGCHR